MRCGAGSGDTRKGAGGQGRRRSEIIPACPAGGRASLPGLGSQRRSLDPRASCSRAASWSLAVPMRWKQKLAYPPRSQQLGGAIGGLLGSRLIPSPPAAAADVDPGVALEAPAFRVLLGEVIGDEQRELGEIQRLGVVRRPA